MAFFYLGPMIFEDFLDGFASWAGREPYLLFTAPGRINLIGEHTDYNGGYCLPAAISRSIWFALIPSHETEILALNTRETWSPSDHRNIPKWTVYLRGVMELCRQQGLSFPYFKLAFGGDLPQGAGLSSSSALTCGFISILNAFASWQLPVSQLTSYAVKAEKASGLDGGMMDQICIMNGILDHALLIDCRSWNFKPVAVRQEHMSWLVVDSCIHHNLVDSDYNLRSASCKRMLARAQALFPETMFLSDLSSDQVAALFPMLTRRERSFIEYVHQENDRVLRFAEALQEHNWKTLGSLLYESHEGLRKKYQVSCPELDYLVHFAKNSGIAYGARMMGGGFGGSTLHLISKEDVGPYSHGISKAYKNRFGFEPRIFEAHIRKGVHQIRPSQL